MLLDLKHEEINIQTFLTVETGHCIPRERQAKIIGINTVCYDVHCKQSVGVEGYGVTDDELFGKLVLKKLKGTIETTFF